MQGRTSYKVHSIGEIKEEAYGGIVELQEVYKEGLRHLGLFSHAILIYKTNREEAQNFKTQVVKLIEVDEQQGKLVIEGEGDKVIGGEVLDIKPYFPCEDKVRESSIDRNKTKETFTQEGLMYKEEKSLSEKRSEKEKNEFQEKQKECEEEIASIGEIRQIEGKYYLYLNEKEGERLKDYEGVSHIKVFWWFHRFDKPQFRRTMTVQPPYEKAPRTGVFATRSPIRPNTIAMTTVKVKRLEVAFNRIEVSEMDCFDHTPLIKLAAYQKATDYIEEVKVPFWVEHWPKYWQEGEEEEQGKSVQVSPSPLALLKAWNGTKETPINKDKFEEKQEVEPTTRENQSITIVGARQNNLKNINVAIPYGKITTLSGVSGSGKSSLAFDTLYAESQRKLMSYMGTKDTPLPSADIDQILGLPPAIAVSQAGIGHNPRSTVGTLTGLEDGLKALFVAIGIRHCPECGEAIVPMSEEQIIRELEALKEKMSFQIYPYNKPEESQEVACSSSHTSPLKDLVSASLKKGEGALVVKLNEGPTLLLQTKQMCYRCQKILFELTTSTLSFNNPLSMCPVCKGLGKKLEPQISKIITNPKVSILDGASPWWGNLRQFQEKPNANWMKGEILALAKGMDVDLEKTWEELPEDFKKRALWGTGEEKFTYSYETNRGRSGDITRPVEGAISGIKRYILEGSGEAVKRLIETFMEEEPCPSCQGERLLREGRMITIGEKRYPEVMSFTLEALNLWLKEMPTYLSQEEAQKARPLIKSMVESLSYYQQLGLEYLTLNREVPSLSGGEFQRLRLGALLGGDLAHMLYILDEPSMGLHPRDSEELMTLIHKLRDKGNTVVMVEHNRSLLEQTDYLVDIGPGAGVKGGEVVAMGNPQEIMDNQYSITGPYLAQTKRITRKKVEKANLTNWVEVKGITAHNLKTIDIAFPVGAITCIVGVSGSGKTTLLKKGIYPAMVEALTKKQPERPFYKSVGGKIDFSQIVKVDQKPIGKSPRSNPATLLGIMDELRKLFAATPEAKERGYKSSMFSFNTTEGGCGHCHGAGKLCTPVAFMADIWSECPICKGKRYKKEVLEVKVKGKNMADILEMHGEEAYDFFKEVPALEKLLKVLVEVGLGYLKLGQSATTLSGGEAQRLKLAKELVNEGKGRTLYLLDEPSTGLHFEDIDHLLKLLEKLIKQGHSVIMVEHSIELIKNADWLIELGPEGGTHGGNLLIQGTVEEVKKCKDSIIGSYLG